MVYKRKKFLLIAGLIFLSLTVTGCYKTNLEKGDEAFASGNYQQALSYYNAHLEEYIKRMGGTYTSLESAKADAMKLVEGYYKAGLAHEKMGDMASARAMYLKAKTDTYDIKYGYYEKVEVYVPAGYREVWVPGYYKDVWVDGYYDSNGVYVNGYYKKVWVDGHYETRWVEAHYELRDVYQEKVVRIKISSPYIDQAIEKIGSIGPRLQSETTLLPPSTNSDKQLKEAYDRMAAAYKAWTAEGMPKSGTSYTNYINAKAEYERLLTGRTTQGQ